MRRLVLALLILLALLPLPAQAAPLPQTAPCVTAAMAALSKVGAPYVWGQKGPDSFDCSGLVYWAYQQAGVSIGVSTYDQAANGVPIPCSLNDLAGTETTCWAPGDLIFLSYSTGQHVALYVDDGLFVDAYNPSTGVILHNAADSFYRDHFWQARRIVSGCEGSTVSNLTTPTTPTPGGPGIESVAGVLSPITLSTPWQCGACVAGSGQNQLKKWPDPDPPVKSNGWFDININPLYPFQWLAVPLLCHFLSGR